MNFYGIQSARYSTPSTAIDAPVFATRDSGAIENRFANDDIEGGGMRAFIADGGKISPFIAPEFEPEPVPASITPLEARNGLRAWQIGRDQIAAFLGAIEDPLEREEAEDAWEYATAIDRSNVLIAGCAAFLGKTEADIDQFFRDAVKKRAAAPG